MNDKLRELLTWCAPDHRDQIYDRKPLSRLPERLQDALIIARADELVEVDHEERSVRATVKGEAWLLRHSEPRLTVDVDDQSITFDGHTFSRLPELGVRIIAGLQAHGGWATAAQLRSRDPILPERLDKAIGRLPAALRELIESDSQDGYRLTLPVR